MKVAWAYLSKYVVEDLALIDIWHCHIYYSARDKVIDSVHLSPVSVCLSISTEIARSGDLGIRVTDKCN